jgi:spoIIIJ-associated protein
MAEGREFEGKDLEEVLGAASASMGIAEPELDYEIVEQGRRGLFGVGAKSIRIRVMMPVHQLTETAIRKKGKKEARTDAPPREVSADDVESVSATLQRMLDLMGLELQAKAQSDGSGVSVELDGSDTKLLSQKEGQLLSALQFLLNRMARRAWPDAGRIRLSGSGQGRRRDDDLVELTREVAEQVTRTGRTKRLHQMNAYERRLVHITVREYEGLGSRSEGNGHLKRVRVFRR